ncbi:hypothetical protein [Archangium lansingense]|uniref:Uncharacterized protein n=1 Tax=Archangium lansingense TaxID=2995310 RepID=A0ABT4AMF3_9BACT|nr:hypothetical protein [Archangium lansinium]MCY1082354.1 hypothetical protein [Archangium lansinium]
MTAWPARADGLPRFVRERIVVTLLEEGFQVEGLYVFRSTAPGEMTFSLQYPFPAEPGAEPAEVLEVRGARLGARAPDAVTLLVPLHPAGQETVVEITYRQRMGPRRARYLVTTALAWGRPLERAEFLVRAPRTWSNPRCSWPLPPAERHGQTSEWRWRFEPFLPRSELDLEWTSP